MYTFLICSRVIFLESFVYNPTSHIGQNDLDWVTIETNPSYGPHKRFYRATYTVDLEGKSHKMHEPLLGFVLRYGRMQGEKMVNNHMLNGFWGIIQMTVWPMDSENRKSQPSCTFTNNQTYGANKNVVVCLYNRNEADAKVWQRVQTDYPNATYFKSIERTMSGISAPGEWKMVYFQPQNMTPPDNTPLYQVCCTTWREYVIPKTARDIDGNMRTLVQEPPDIVQRYRLEHYTVVEGCTTCICGQPWNLEVQAIVYDASGVNFEYVYIVLKGAVRCINT